MDEEASSQLPHAPNQADFIYSSQYNNPRHASSTTPYSSTLWIPITHFTKKFFEEAGELEELSRAAPSSKILQHLELFHAEIPVGITIDAELCGWIKSFSDIKSKIKNNDQIKAYPSNKMFRLQKYISTIFYIEVLTMILPKTSMEGLRARSECFVELANAASHPQDYEQDPDLYEVAGYLSRKSINQWKERRTMLWIFIYRWARQYMPGIFVEEMIVKEPQLPKTTVA
ncbi:hypothetical protein PCANC_24218 [Puccinia coronata f. sp. avenae]|uniref:Uncharacterized protein n=2 Tax=Puccinia coronata f. sp. avenae TaxID=200324 RepID=A0A2N5S3J7_9BASI|nr:hypothetical protein PCANC_24218 [Puccinia coronata f. sp. avenae]